MRTMKRPLVASVIAIAMGCNLPVFAQESLIGTYDGTRQGVGAKNRTTGVRLVIASVEGAIVKGTATRFDKGACHGDFPMEGTIEGTTLILKATERNALDCNFKLNVKVEGTKLVGTGNGDKPIELSK